MIKAAFFDVDGTLLSHKTKSVPQSAREAVAKLRAQGIKCVVATGRQIRQMRHLPVADIPFDGYITLNGQINALAAEVRANKDAQCAINQQQAVYNGVNTATLNCIQNQVQQLFGITKLVIPNTSVCPGWGNVNITPAAAANTPAT